LNILARRELEFLFSEMQNAKAIFKETIENKLSPINELIHETNEGITQLNHDMIEKLNRKINC